MITIGSARHDENGKYNGGKKGDQTGHEVETQDFYVHSKGWYVLRPKDTTIADRMAEAMLEACANENIGYNQDDRDSIIPLGVNTKTKCNSDCSSLVRACIMYATGKSFPDFYTGDEALTLENSGLFEKRVKYADGYQLKRGDVLVTCKKGHTVIVVKDDTKTTKVATKSTTRDTIKLGYSDTVAKYCANLQSLLNFFGYRDADYNKLSEDGCCGAKTEQAIKNAQEDLKNKGFYHDAIDGSCGPNTYRALDQLANMTYYVKTTTDVNCRKPAKIQTLGKVQRVVSNGTKVKVSNWKGKWLYLPDCDGYISGNCAARIS